MIAEALRDEVDTYAARMRKHNPLFFKAADGTLGRPAIAFYMANLRELLYQAERHIGRARDRAAKSNPELALHYAAKLQEEIGHHTWAERDLERLGAHAESGCGAGAAMRAYIRWIDAIIEEDPALYLAYALFAEYLVVLLGPEWLRLLETRCNIPATSMTAIGNHIEHDRDHVDEAMDEIDRLVADPSKLRRMREVVREASINFDRFCFEVCGRDGERVHTPAA